MSKLPKEKRDKIIIVIIGTIIVLAGLWFVLIRPLRDNAVHVTKETDEFRSQVALGQSTIATTQQVAAALQTVTDQLKAAQDTMAAGDLYAWMIQTMSQFKTAYKVEIPQISRENPCDVGSFPQFPYKAVSFSVHGTGYYHDFGTFLADFENNFPYMRVQNLDLEPTGGQLAEDAERLNFRMELVTLVRPVSP